MNYKYPKYSYIVLFLLLIPSITFAEFSVDISSLAAQLYDEDWQVRQQAAFELYKTPDNNAARDALVKAFIYEYNNRGSIIDTGGEGGHLWYYWWLFRTVKLFKDERLFKIFQKMGNADALIQYGEKGVVAILKKMETYEECGKSLRDLKALNNALDPQSEIFLNNKNIRNNIKKSLLQSLNKFKHPAKDIEWFEAIADLCGSARESAVKGLSYLGKEGDVEAINTIKKVANTDPFKKKIGSVQKYPVREEAQKIMETLSQKKKN